MEGFHQCYGGWAGLPGNVLIRIVQRWADGHDVARLMQVCKSWYKQLHNCTWCNTLYQLRVQWFTCAADMIQLVLFNPSLSNSANPNRTIFGAITQHFSNAHCFQLYDFYQAFKLEERLNLNTFGIQWYGVDLFLPLVNETLHCHKNNGIVYLWIDQYHMPTTRQLRVMQFWNTHFPSMFSYGCATFSSMRYTCMTSESSHLLQVAGCCPFSIYRGIVVWVRINLNRPNVCKKQKISNQSNEKQLAKLYYQTLIDESQPLATRDEFHNWYQIQSNRELQYTVQLTIIIVSKNYVQNFMFQTQAPWTWNYKDIESWIQTHPDYISIECRNEFNWDKKNVIFSNDLTYTYRSKNRQILKRNRKMTLAHIRLRYRTHYHCLRGYMVFP